MPISPKSWQNRPSTATPINAAALIDVETRLGAYTDAVAASVAPVSFTSFSPDPTGATFSDTAFASFQTAMAGKTGRVPKGTYKFQNIPAAFTVSGTMLDFEPGAIFDFSACPKGDGVQGMLRFVGVEAAQIALTANALKGSQMIKVAGGSEPANDVDFKIGSTAVVSTGAPNGGTGAVGEYNTVVRPFGTLAANITNVQTTITLDNTTGDSRIGAAFPRRGGTLLIGSEQITYPVDTMTVDTTTITFTGVTRGANSTSAVSHTLGDSVTLPSGYFAARNPVLDDYNTADTAVITPTTFIERCGIQGAPRIIGGGLRAGSTGTGGSADWNHVAIQFQFARDIILNIPGGRLENFDQRGIDLQDTLDSEIHAPAIAGGKSRTNSFYGIVTKYACQDLTIYGGAVEDSRHAFTTDGLTTPRMGIPRRITYVNGHGRNNTATAFDSHAMGEDISFLGCTVLNPVDAGFQARAPSVTIVDGFVRWPTKGVWLRNASLRPSRYIIQGVTIEDSQVSGLLFGDDTTSVGNGYVIDYVRVRDLVVLRARGDASLLFVGTNTRLYGLDIKAKVKDQVWVGPGTALTNVDDSTIDVEIYNHPATAQAVKLIGCNRVHLTVKANFASLSTGTAVRLEGCTGCYVSVECKTAGTGVSCDNSCSNIVVDGDLRGCTTTVSMGTGVGNVVNAMPNSVADDDPRNLNDVLRGAEVATMYKVEAVDANVGTIASGDVVGAVAVCRKDGTYTKIRIVTGGVGPTSITDARGGVWDSAGTTKLAETANESATVTTLGTSYTLNLLSSVILKRGDKVRLGYGQIGTTPSQLRGRALTTTINNVGTPLGYQATGWTTGVLPTSLNTAGGRVPWMELLP